MSDRAAPEECANCGASIPRGARSCPECGADERTGWRENDDTRYDGLDLPDSAYEGESTPSRKPIRRGLAWYWWVTAALVLYGLIMGAVGLQAWFK